MSRRNVVGNEVSVDEQAYEQATERTVDEDGFEVVDETPEFRATVQMEVQAKVDANHPEGIVDTKHERIYGATLVQEERIKAREAELARISARAEFGTQDGRAERTRAVVGAANAKQREAFDRRAASVDPRFDPNRGDPREELSREELAAVNRQSMRLAEKLDGWSRVAIGRRLADRVLQGQELTCAVVGVFEELQTAPGRVVPIGKLEAVNRKEDRYTPRLHVDLWNDAPGT